MKNSVITDEKIIDELLDRGVEKIYPSREELKKQLMKGEKIRLYGGFDPTAPSLHVGNAVLINKLSQFQALGHEVVFLIGDFTGMIGDPTDKTATRKKLTRETVLENCRTYQKQASVYLDFEGENKARVVYNSDWLGKLTFSDLIEISSNFTVQQMIQRDMFQKRIEEEKPIHLHEFFYPIAQGYDSVKLDVDLEVGGNDQMFNMMAGRHLMQALGMKDKTVLTMKLLADDDGKKMGKSEGNAVFLDQEPKNIYGALMSWSDGVIVPALELLTKVSMSEIAKIKDSMSQGANPRDYKMRLAYEIVKIYHGQEEAEKAQEYFVHTISNKETPSEVKEIVIAKDSIRLVEFIVLAGLSKSNGEAKRKIEQGGVSINQKRESDWQKVLTKKDNQSVLKVGKFGFAKIIFK